MFTSVAKVGVAMLSVSLLSSACASAATSTTHRSPTLDATQIAPMIAKSSTGSTTFPDPYPVYRSEHGTSVPDPHIVFGSKAQMLTCPGRIRPGCYQQHQISITLSPAVDAQLHAAGTVVKTTFNHNPYEDASGNWQMALSVKVHRAGQTSGSHSSRNTWSVVLHAHPTNGSTPAPTAWTADSVLEGSLAHDARANYDGKYFEDDGSLYLLYSRRLTSNPAHDGVVAQRMTSPTSPAQSAPVVLLEPNGGAGFSSEKFFVDKPKADFKLIETGNVTKVGDHYLMAYSTGAFDESDYKTGIASSATFLPRKGTTYRKTVVPDPNDVWHNPSHEDVRYVLQSQKPNWAGYVGRTVEAPGVPSIVQDSGKWFVIFAGYPADDTKARSSGTHFDPAERNPYLAMLNGGEL